MISWPLNLSRHQKAHSSRDKIITDGKAGHIIGMGGQVRVALIGCDGHANKVRPKINTTQQVSGRILLSSGKRCACIRIENEQKEARRVNVIKSRAR